MILPTTKPALSHARRRRFRAFALCLATVGAFAAAPGVSAQTLAPGAVIAWGNNYSGEASVPPRLSGVKAIAAGTNHSLALKTDGTVVAWGFNHEGQASVPAGLSGVKAIAGGAYHSLALRADGTVVAWGRSDKDGQADVPPSLTEVKAISAGYHNLALKTDGTVVAWGANSYGESNVPAGLRDVKAIAAGGHHSMALKTDDTVVAWGNGVEGQTNVPSGLAGVTVIAAGGRHSLAANAVVEPDAPSYAFSGFLAPVSNPDMLNHGKAGSTYPLKWQFKDESGHFVASLDAVRSVTFKPAQCGAFASVLPDALTAQSAGKSALRYDAASNHYAYNWATPSTPGCYTVFLSLDSGQVQQAYFNLR